MAKRKRIKIEVKPVKGKNGLFTIKVITESEEEKTPKSIAELSSILSERVTIHSKNNRVSHQ